MIDWPNMTFEERSEAAKRDDILDKLVPSDIRVLLSSIAFLKKQNEKLDRFTRMMMKVLKEIEESQGVPDQITDAVADILADWSEE